MSTNNATTRAILGKKIAFRAFIVIHTCIRKERNLQSNNSIIESVQLEYLLIVFNYRIHQKRELYRMNGGKELNRTCLLYGTLNSIQFISLTL